MPKQIMRISRKGLNFIKQWEGFVPYVYDDLVPARIINGRRTYVKWEGGRIIGTLTIGYGHTSAARGKWPMHAGSTITEAQATELLDVDLDPVEAYVNKVVTVPLTQGQFDSLVSITYNFGEGNLRKSVLLARLNAGDYRGARAAFDLYVNSKGRRLQGLVNRRNAEQLLWDSRDATEQVIRLKPSKEEAVETPKEVDTPVQPTAATTKEGATALGQTGVGTGGMINEGTSTWGKAQEVANQAADVKMTAESLGVEPVGFFSVFGSKVGSFLWLLVTNPLFWVFTAVAVSGFAIFLFRRWRAQQEVVSGEYQIAGTDLETLYQGQVDDGMLPAIDGDTYRVDGDESEDDEVEEVKPKPRRRKAKSKKR